MRLRSILISLAMGVSTLASGTESSLFDIYNTIRKSPASLIQSSTGSHSCKPDGDAYYVVACALWNAVHAQSKSDFDVARTHAQQAWDALMDIEVQEKQRSLLVLEQEALDSIKNGNSQNSPAAIMQMQGLAGMMNSQQMLSSIKEGVECVYGTNEGEQYLNQANQGIYEAISELTELQSESINVIRTAQSMDEMKKIVKAEEEKNSEDVELIKEDLEIATSRAARNISDCYGGSGSAMIEASMVPDMKSMQMMRYMHMGEAEIKRDFQRQRANLSRSQSEATIHRYINSVIQASKMSGTRVGDLEFISKIMPQLPGGVSISDMGGSLIAITYPLFIALDSYQNKNADAAYVQLTTAIKAFSKLYVIHAHPDEKVAELIAISSELAIPSAGAAPDYTKEINRLQDLSEESDLSFFADGLRYFSELRMKQIDKAGSLYKKILAQHKNNPHLSNFVLESSLQTVFTLVEPEMRAGADVNKPMFSQEQIAILLPAIERSVALAASSTGHNASLVEHINYLYAYFLVEFELKQNVEGEEIQKYIATYEKAKSSGRGIFQKMYTDKMIDYMKRPLMFYAI